MSQQTSSGALSPYRVIDLTTEDGWLCGKVLADLGAEVIKVEPPGGDPGRRHGLRDQRRPADDPEANLGWWFANQHKRSIELDFDQPGDQHRLRALCAGADAVIESFPTGWLAGRDLGADSLLAANPALVITSISAFGRSGPYAGHQASDLVISAMCGLQFLTGNPDGEPTRISAPQLFRHASVEAAVHTVVALYHARRHGQGQQIDVSAQLAGIRTLMNAQDFALLEGWELHRSGGYTGYSHARFRAVMPCLDGYVTVLATGGQLGGPMMRHLFTWAEESGAAVDRDAAAVDFTAVNFAEMGQAFFAGVSTTLTDLFARFTKAEIYQRALDQLLLVAPLNTVADLRLDEQLAAREYFQPVTRQGQTIHYAGAWVRMGATPLRAPSAAPAVGQHQDPVLAEPARSPVGTQVGPHRGPASSADPADPANPTAPADPAVRARAYDGLRVLDLSWIGVGPMAASYLANHGATVIKVESSIRPDVLRLTPPFRDSRPGLNNGHFCANMNAGKLGLGVDLTHPEGREVIWRIIEGWADVVLESFTPRTLAGWGLDWPAIAARRPDIVMLSTCMQGQTGPRRNYRGFGNLMGGLSGFYHLTGPADGDPVMIYGAYTDFICQRFSALALAAAIDHRDRTGQGQHLDLAQLEAALQFQGPELLDYECNGQVAKRHGNRDQERSPHLVMACRAHADGSESWLALACEDDAQWQALVRALGSPAWATAADLVTVAGRKAREEPIETELRAWAAERDAGELFAVLQPHVSCGPVLSPHQLHEDPQIRHRGYFVPLEHQVMGTVPYDGVAAELSLTPAGPTSAGPCVGQHTFEVLTDLIGMDPDEVARLLAEEVLEITG